ncbi:MAG: toprim domain-containing protein [Phocaeicola sp.]
MDSIRIYDRTHWYRWSRQFDKGSNGGSQIDFLRVFCNMEVKEAVFWLLDFAGYRRNDEVMKSNIRVVKVKKQEKKEFVLPEAASNNNYLYSYLLNERCISRGVIDYFIKHELIYESKQYHNIVFKGNDKAGITRFANLRGVFDKDGKAFKCDVACNDKRYGFNIWNNNSEEVVVFEGAIDLISYVDMTGDYDSNMIALGMIADAPLETFLEEHRQISSIKFCLDNDEPGRKATKELCDKYYGLGFDVEDVAPPNDYKDCNEWLVSIKSKALNNNIKQCSR